VEIGIKAAQCPEKEYINGIFLALWLHPIALCLYIARLNNRAIRAGLLASGCSLLSPAYAK
jgi:hypothetical protein